LEFALKLSGDEYKLASESAELQKAYGDGILADIALLQHLADLVEVGSWDDVSAAFRTLAFGKIGVYRGADAVKERIKAMRETVKKEVGKLQKLFISDDAACRAEIRAIRPLA